MTEVHVGNLTFATDADALRAVFQNCTFAKVVSRNGRSKGFGYVSFASQAEANKAIEQIDGTTIDGRQVRLQISNKSAGGGAQKQPQQQQQQRNSNNDRAQRQPQQQQQQRNSNNDHKRHQDSPRSSPSPTPKQARTVAASHQSRTTSTTRAAFGSQTFASLSNHGVAPAILQAISQVFGYETMTKVQEQTLPVSCKGNDVLAKAKTGTGKTIAFLIPALSRVLSTRSAQRGLCRVLIVSPTRELATQIKDEAEQLLRFASPKPSLQVVFGGTNVRADLSKFRSYGGAPEILVGTPGRLNDHLENNGLARACSRLEALIFDEADQLLEMGFRPDITRMLNMLPQKQSRQTLLFSATMPKDVRAIAEFALRPQYSFVDCVGKEDAAGTHARVPQRVTVIPTEQTFAELVAVIRTEMQHNPQDFKIMVFFTTARFTQLAAELFNKIRGFNVLEIHSRKSQGHRTKTSAIFRDASAQILFSSDVSARGMDYPDVTMVAQVGLPSDVAQYIHRLGRTARAGKSGHGHLLLADSGEAGFFLAQLKKQPIEQCRVQATQQDQNDVDQAMDQVAFKTRSMAYQAWIGFNNSHLKKLRWSQTVLVEWANFFSDTVLRLSETPALQAKTVGKMGLKNVPGLRIEGRNGVPRSEQSSNGRGNGGGGRGGGGRNGRGGGGGRGGRGRGGGGRGGGRW